MSHLRMSGGLISSARHTLTNSKIDILMKPGLSDVRPI